MPIETHDFTIQIEPNEILWRYMNLEKFYSLIKTESLFFCRADKFPDHFEGTYPRREVEYRPIFFDQINKLYKETSNPKKIREQISIKEENNKMARMATVVNCWHINKFESETMWRLYLNSDLGVAIQTNPYRLFHSLKEAQESIFPSKIRYIDYENDIWYNPNDYPVQYENILTPFVHKRIEFNSENEFRLFHIINEVLFEQGEEYWLKRKNSKGIFIKVDINQLIEKVILPPHISDFEYCNIESFTKDLGYSFDFKKSELSKDPYY